LFAAYYFFTKKGYEVTLASVKGGKLPIDPKSVVTPYLTTVVKKGLTDGTASAPSYLKVHSTTTLLTAGQHSILLFICEKHSSSQVSSGT